MSKVAELFKLSIFTKLPVCLGVLFHPFPTGVTSLWVHFIPCFWWSCDWGEYDGAAIRGGIWFILWFVVCVWCCVKKCSQRCLAGDDTVCATLSTAAPSSKLLPPVLLSQQPSISP
jgi:hypothetical protein